jgi:hypothetical protein
MKKGIFKFLFAEDPQAILAEINPDGVIDPQPPDAADYRDADIMGVSCQTCVRFGVIGALDPNAEGDELKGICGLWEAWVEGGMVCDRWASDTPPMNEDGEWDWEFSDTTLAEVHMADAPAATEEKGLVRKAIMRTGEWPVIPSDKGIIKRPLKIVREGQSDPETGTIALTELVENFGKAIKRVQVPLSDDEDDHKNISRVNTGFVERIWVEDGPEESFLMADINFTEPEVKEKALRGTYADVSCGVPFGLSVNGKKFGACLEHVAVTNRPFMDKLGPFFLTATDQISEQLKDKSVNHFLLSWKPNTEGEEKTEPEKTEPEKEEEPPKKVEFSYQDQVNALSQALFHKSLSPNNYKVADIKGDKATIYHNVSDTSWEAAFEFSDGKATLAEVANWKIIESNEEKPAGKKSSGSSSGEPSLEEARRMREIRLSQPTPNDPTQGGTKMASENGSLSVELSELPEEARARVQGILDENANLRKRNRESEADERVDELKKLGLEERPGALKFYREVFLADDGGPAIVLLSDSAQKERLTALEVLDRFIEGVKGSDGKVVLSDQALASENDQKPPVDAGGEKKSLEERTAEAKEALYGKK